MSVAPAPTSLPAPLLSLRGLSKSFGAVRALRRVDLDLHAGRIHALVGENGAGKSTLISVVAGLLAPDEGELRCDGHTLHHHGPRRARALGITVLHQVPRWFGELSVAENFLFGEQALCFSKRGLLRRAGERLAALGVDLDPRARTGSLSLAKQQLLALARAWSEGARLIVLDEPTAILPAVEAEELLERMRRLRAEGRALLFISHRLEEVLAVSDHVHVLRDGELVHEGEARGLTREALVARMVGRELAEPRPAVPPAARAPLFAVHGLCQDALGLRDVSLTIAPGEILGLAGLVGAGRTELLRTLVGLERIDRGKIELAGRAIRPRGPRDALALGIAYLPEDRRRAGLIPPMSVRANLSLPQLARFGRAGWLDERRERAFAEAQRTRFHIHCASVEAPAESLSGGNQQKVVLARWLACQPRVLLLDEPTQGIDVGGRSAIHELVRAEAARGTAILLASSDLNEIRTLAHRIGVMRAGALVADLPGDAPPELVLEHALRARA